MLSKIYKKLKITNKIFTGSIASGNNSRVLHLTNLPISFKFEMFASLHLTIFGNSSKQVQLLSESMINSIIQAFKLRKDDDFLMLRSLLTYTF